MGQSGWSLAQTPVNPLQTPPSRSAGKRLPPLVFPCKQAELAVGGGSPHTREVAGSNPAAPMKDLQIGDFNLREAIFLPWGCARRAPQVTTIGRRDWLLESGVPADGTAAFIPKAGAISVALRTLADRPERSSARSLPHARYSGGRESSRSRQASLLPHGSSSERRRPIRLSGCDTRRSHSDFRIRLGHPVGSLAARWLM
jgi:hypothetical protein